MLQLKDSMLDFEAKLENTDGKEHVLKEEMATLKDKLHGKDTAIQCMT